MSPISEIPCDALEQLEFEVDLTCFQRVLNTIAALQLEYESMRTRGFSGQNHISGPAVEIGPGADRFADIGTRGND